MRRKRLRMCSPIGRRRRATGCPSPSEVLRQVLHLFLVASRWVDNPCPAAHVVCCVAGRSTKSSHASARPLFESSMLVALWFELSKASRVALTSRRRLCTSSSIAFCPLVRFRMSCFMGGDEAHHGLLHHPLHHGRHPAKDVLLRLRLPRRQIKRELLLRGLPVVACPRFAVGGDLGPNLV